MRAATLRCSEKDNVRFTAAVGASRIGIVARAILPNIMTPLARNLASRKTLTPTARMAVSRTGAITGFLAMPIRFSLTMSPEVWRGRLNAGAKEIETDYECNGVGQAQAEQRRSR